MSYSKVGWKDYPDQSTPINAANLKHMDDKIADLDANKANGTGGVANSALKWNTPCKINNVNVDGSEDVSLPSMYETPMQAKALNAVGWYRIGKFNISHYSNVMIYLSTQYSNNPNCAFNVSLSSAYNTAVFTQLSGSLNNPNGTPPVSKIRFVQKPSSECYIEIYYNEANLNPVYIKMSGMNPITCVDFTEGSIPTGYTATEFELSANPVKADAIETKKIVYNGLETMQIVKSVTAPSDTTVVWLDITTMKFKIYVSGAWTAL